MKIFCNRSFKIAQQLSREAVANGSAEGYEYDWQIAMTYLQIAYGHATIQVIENIDRAIEEASREG